MKAAVSIPEKLASGAVVGGRYEAERKVGEGSFAEVWSGRDRQTGQRVALKHLKRALASDAEIVQRFEREAYFLSRVESRHVAKINELVVDPAYGMVLVMELIEGHLLSTLMARTLLSVEEAIDLGLDLLSGLRDLHAARIIHRDLKPSNIILTPSGTTYRPVIFDFSLSRLAHRKRKPGEPSTTPSMNPITRADVTLGTIEYMGPEQILDSKVDERTDVYAVGAILYSAVLGEHAFAEFEDIRDLARAKLEREAPELATGRSDPLMIAFEAAITRALRRRPADRFQSADEMREELTRLHGMGGQWGPEGDRGWSAQLVARGSAGSIRAARRVSSREMDRARVPGAPPSSRPPSPPPAPRAEADWLAGLKPRTFEADAAFTPAPPKSAPSAPPSGAPSARPPSGAQSGAQSARPPSGASSARPSAPPRARGRMIAALAVAALVGMGSCVAWTWWSGASHGASRAAH